MNHNCKGNLLEDKCAPNKLNYLQKFITCKILQIVNKFYFMFQSLYYRMLYISSTNKGLQNGFWIFFFSVTLISREHFVFLLLVFKISICLVVTMLFLMAAVIKGLVTTLYCNTCSGGEYTDSKKQSIIDCTFRFSISSSEYAWLQS